MTDIVTSWDLVRSTRNILCADIHSLVQRHKRSVLAHFSAKVYTSRTETYPILLSHSWLLPDAVHSWRFRFRLLLTTVINAVLLQLIPLHGDLTERSKFSLELSVENTVVTLGTKPTLPFAHTGPVYILLIIAFPFTLWRFDPISGHDLLLHVLAITLRHSTVGGTPLDEWSAWRRYL